MSFDRRTDGPVLLRAEIGAARRWRRRRSCVRVTSRRLWWGVTGAEESVDWTDVLAVEQRGRLLLVRYLTEDCSPAELRVVLDGPVGYLVAEEVCRRSEAARCNARRAQPLAA